MKGLFVFAQSVHLNPNPSRLPGGEVLQSLTDGIGGFALILSLVGVLIGAAMWALGSTSTNYQQTVIGKKATVSCFLAALLIGGSPSIINFFYGAGHKI
jgi:hypothetical protein